MKHALIVSLILFSLLAPCRAASPTDTVPNNQLSANQLPEVLRRSIDGYIRGGSSSAITTLMDNYPQVKGRDSFSNRLRNKFAQAEKELGVLLQVEPMFVRRVTASYHQYFLLYCYRDGVLFARFDIYYSQGMDKVLGGELSLDPDDFLPPLRDVVEY